LLGLITRSRCVAHVADGCRVSTTDDTEYDGGYGTPAAFVLRKAIGSWAFGGTMSYLATAEALVAAQGCSARHEWVWAKLVGLQAAGVCLIPSDDLRVV